MTSGDRYPSETRFQRDERTGVVIRQVTSAPSIHHQPFFFVPAYDDAMRWLVFISHRTGNPQILVEDRTAGELVQLTDLPDIAEWSIYPSHDGKFVYFTAGARGCRVNTETCAVDVLVDFNNAAMREEGMVGAAMGTTALSACDRWWAVKFNDGDEACLAVIDTRNCDWDIILRRDTISHMQFCPDDANLLFYAGPLNDRVWIIHRDGSGNRRLYERQSGEWITHESWIPHSRELAFVDWPHGVRGIRMDTGELRQVATFNAWHPVSNRQGTAMVCDTNFPDIGLQLFDPREGRSSAPRTLCFPEATSRGDHWNGPFPYENGPIPVYAPQHTHPHPSFSPDGRRVVFTSDRTGTAQVYEVELSDEWQSELGDPVP
jgi:oligogalacturonide lyase